MWLASVRLAPRPPRRAARTRRPRARSRVRRGLEPPRRGDARRGRQDGADPAAFLTQLAAGAAAGQEEAEARPHVALRRRRKSKITLSVPAEGGESRPDLSEPEADRRGVGERRSRRRRSAIDRELERRPRRYLLERVARQRSLPRKSGRIETGVGCARLPVVEEPCRRRPRRRRSSPRESEEAVASRGDAHDAPSSDAASVARTTEAASGPTRPREVNIIEQVPRFPNVSASVYPARGRSRSAISWRRRSTIRTDGYYARGASIGEGGDFVTSPHGHAGLRGGDREAVPPRHGGPRRRRSTSSKPAPGSGDASSRTSTRRSGARDPAVRGARPADGDRAIGVGSAADSHPAASARRRA